MTWDEPATRTSSSPRIVEPPKPEDRFGRDEAREPDLFAALTPVPRSARPAPQEPVARPKSPSSVLARASEERAADSSVDLDIPTFDRRGVRPALEAPRNERTRFEAPRVEPEALGDVEPALFESQPLVAHEPPPAAAAHPVAAPSAAPPPISMPRNEPMPAGPDLDGFEDDADLPLHSSSSDPGALDTIAYLTNELAGDIAAFDRRETRPRSGESADPYASSRATRTWVDTAETQLDADAAPRPVNDDPDLDLDARPGPAVLEWAGTASRPPVAVSAPASSAHVRDEQPLGAEREPAWTLDATELASEAEVDAFTADVEPHDHEHDPEISDSPRAHRPAFATFVIERAAAAPPATEPTAPSPPAALGDEPSRGAERATIDWDELRAARARDWATFDAQSPPPPVISRPPRAPEPSVETPRAAATAVREASRVEARPSARDVTRDVERDKPRAAPPVVIPPQPIPGPIEPPSRWLDAEAARNPRRGWNDAPEPSLLDDLDDSVDSAADERVEAAPFTSRAVAFAIDVAIVASTAVVAVLLGVIAFGTTDYQAIDFVHSFQVLDDAFNWLLALIGFVYFSVSHAWTGATLGKAMLRLEVVNADRRGPPTVGRSLLRTAGYLVSSVLGIGFLLAIRKPHRALHDYAAGTVVVRTRSNDPL